MALAQKREIDATLVTELSCWATAPRTCASASVWCAGAADGRCGADTLAPLSASHSVPLIRLAPAVVTSDRTLNG